MTMTNSNASLSSAAAALAVTAAAATSASAAEAEDKFLAGIRSDDEDANYAAWSTAEQVDPTVIPKLSELLSSKKPNVRNAATEALKNIVHAVGKTINPASLVGNAGRPDDPGRMDRRQQVVAQLVDIIGGKGQEIEKVTALRHLSLIGSTDDVGDVAALIHDPRLQEEAAFCLERIPGKTAEEALLAALPAASDAFKPRILAALGHRRAEEAANACVEAMRAGDPAIALAGMKAWARIGEDTGEDLEFPDRDALRDWQKTEFDDSLLRYADAQLEQGNGQAAMDLYREALDREEEHLQCAAIIGLANVGTADAAAAIFPKLDSPDDKVRITARQAWERMADA